MAVKGQGEKPGIVEISSCQINKIPIGENTMRSYSEYKTKIMECSRWLSASGFFGALRGTGGNVSLRVAGEEAFVITPSGLSYDLLTEETMCVLDFGMRLIEGNRQPSIESGLHLKTYQYRADARAVIHTHQTYASVLAVLNRPIPPLFDEVCYHLGPTVEVVPYAFSGTPELMANLEGKLGNRCHGYLLQNHGALLMGSTLEKARLNVELLEKTAKIFLEALASGGIPTSLPSVTVDLLEEVRRGEYGW
jgi:ribulose-5-phosphate 4-epimerase/fuculose-1-phosphate aldolase